MTTYDMDYSTLKGNAKRAKAIQDIVDYLGWERFTQIHLALLAEPPKKLATLRLCLSFAGVQGYPVTAWHELLWGEHEKKANLKVVK